MMRPICTALIAASLLTLAGCGGKPKNATPDETVKAVSKGISEKKPEVIWDLMPPSYQTDVNNLVAAAAAKTDPDLHSKGVEVMSKLLSVLKSKKDFVLGSPMLAQIPNIKKDEFTANYDSAVGILDTIVHSDLANLDKMKKPDIGHFLKETGGKLMEQAAAISKATPGDEFNKELAKLSNVQVKVLSQTDTTAEVEVTTDGKTKTEKMVKVEEKWVPDEMANEWKQKMDEAKQGIDGMNMAQNKLQVLGVMGAVTTILEQLEKAKSQQEFDQLLASAMQNMH